MKKIFFLRKIIFHTCNIVLISIYLYPGSIMGWLVYRNIQKQPQLTSDFMVFSSNHVYAFIVLSLFGLLAYYNSKIKFLFLYLFFISIFLEVCHIFIPQRNFQYQDLLGNFFGVFFIFLLFHLFQYIKGKNSE